MTKNKNTKIVTVNDKDGLVILKSGEAFRFLFPPEGQGEDTDYIRQTMAYFMHALERKDWILEFQEHMTKEYGDDDDNDDNKPPTLKIVK